jgi:hypothetical protein
MRPAARIRKKNHLTNKTMTPIEFPQANKVFVKPEGWTDEECLPAPVFVGEYSNNNPCIISCWQLTDNELKQIAATGVVWLGVVGTQMPPISLSTQNPFEP